MIDQMLRDKLVDAYMVSIPLITLNVLWFVCSLPVITLIPSTAALFYATNQLAHGKPANWQTFVEGFKLYFRKCWVWGILNVLVIVGLVSNIVFYSRLREGWAVWAQGAFIALSFAWLSIQIYCFPVLLEQENPRLGQAFRNSLVLILKRPIYTALQALLLIILMVGSTFLLWPLWMFVTASLCAYLANQAALSSIAHATRKLPSSN